VSGVAESVGDWRKMERYQPSQGALSVARQAPSDPYGESSLGAKRAAGADQRGGHGEQQGCASSFLISTHCGRTTWAVTGTTVIPLVAVTLPQDRPNLARRHPPLYRGHSISLAEEPLGRCCYLCLSDDVGRATECPLGGPESAARPGAGGVAAIRSPHRTPARVRDC